MLRVPVVLGLVASASALSLKTSSEIAAGTWSFESSECEGSKLQGVNLARACGNDGAQACPLEVHGSQWHTLHYIGRVNDGVVGLVRGSSAPGAAYNAVGGEAWVRINLMELYKITKIRLAWYGNYVAQYDQRGMQLHLSLTANDREEAVGGIPGNPRTNYQDFTVNGGAGKVAQFVWAVYPGRLNVQELMLWGCEQLSGHGHGDPHLRNMKGEDFDVMQEGNMVLLETPRGSTPDSLNLSLRADIDRLGAVKCGPTYITAIQLDGKWLGRGVQISSGKVFKQPFEQDSEKHSFGIRVGEDPFFSHVTFLSQSQGYFELPAGASIQVRERTFMIKAKGLTILVQQPKRPRIFLDVEVTGLETLTGEVGGLLGIDDHASAEELPAECM